LACDINYLQIFYIDAKFMVIKAVSFVESCFFMHTSYAMIEVRLSTADNSA